MQFLQKVGKPKNKRLKQATDSQHQHGIEKTQAVDFEKVNFRRAAGAQPQDGQVEEAKDEGPRPVVAHWRA